MDIIFWREHPVQITKNMTKFKNPDHSIGEITCENTNYLIFRESFYVISHQKDGLWLPIHHEAKTNEEIRNAFERWMSMCGEGGFKIMPETRYTAQLKNPEYWIYHYLRADGEEIDMGPFPSEADAKEAMDKHTQFGALTNGPVRVEKDYELYKGNY